MGGKFYVYEHWRPDRDVCFYVGKGMGRRANVMYGRNRYHTNIQSKLNQIGMCVEVRLVAENLTEEEAFEIEMDRIANWTSIGVALANLTSGGEGGSNPSEETRNLMRKAKVGRKLSEKHKRKIGESYKKALTDELRKTLSNSIKIALNKPEVKEKLSKFQKNRVRTKEHYEKVSKALTGRKLSAEHAQKAREASLGRVHPPEEIERRRASLIGKKRSSEAIEKFKNAWTPERREAQRLRTIEMNKNRNSKNKNNTCAEKQIDGGEQ